MTNTEHLMRRTRSSVRHATRCEWIGLAQRIAPNRLIAGGLVIGAVSLASFGFGSSGNGD